MPEQNLPYVVSTGSLTKVLEKIQRAATPDRFTQDFLASKLGLSGGSAKPVIPFLKRTGMLASDGARPVPTVGARSPVMMTGAVHTPTVKESRMPGEALTLPEREEIKVALIEDPLMPWARIARRVGRHRTTIAREVKRNGGRDRYRPAMACHRALTARRRPRSCRLAGRGDLRDRLTAELKLGRSPVAIWADLVAEDIADRPCVETIYTAVYAGLFEVKAAECLRMRRPRRRARQARHPSGRPGLPNISDRPVTIADRSETGHWEADQIIGAHNRSSMLSLTERVTRYSILVTMPNGYAAEDMVAGLVDGLDRIPAHLLRSITFDQGSEWANWPEIAAGYGIDCWFCEPHSPWQRGQVENINRQWRWWFPRGTDLAGTDPGHADHAADIINNQRRRSLDYQSPASLYAAATVQ